jgi:hypothetical protein
MTLTADEMNTLMAEATNGIPEEESRLKPLNPEQREWRRQIGREVMAAQRRGLTVDIPPEMPDANLID